MRKLFFPVTDNGMGLSRTSWAMCFAAACLGVLRDYDVEMLGVSYPYPDGASNKAANEFMFTGAEEMVIIDTDVIFKPEQLTYLLEHNEPLVFGMYPRKQLGLKFPMKWLTDENPFSFNPFDKGVAPLVEVQRIARGFSRYHRSVFEKLSPLVPEYQDEESGRLYKEYWKNLRGGHSDDFAFCDLWRSTGGKVLVDQRINAQHEGSAVYPIPGTW